MALDTAPRNVRRDVSGRFRLKPLNPGLTPVFHGECGMHMVHRPMHYVPGQRGVRWDGLKHFLKYLRQGASLNALKYSISGSVK